MKTAIIHAAVEYTPVTFAADLAAGAVTILPWVGAGVGAGVLLMLTFLGIRKGIGFFKGTAK